MSGTASRPRGYRVAETQRGDTLQAIADRTLGDAGRWTELVALNNLAPPYIVDSLAEMEGTPAGRVLLAGQTIRLPSPPGRPNAVAEDVFGRDLLLAGGQLTANEAGDWATIEGEANLTQAVRHRVVTIPGELQRHRTYGCAVWRLRGRKGSGFANQLGAAFVQRALRADPRVAKAEQVQATIAGDQLNTSGTVIAADGRSLPIAFGYEGE